MALSVSQSNVKNQSKGSTHEEPQHLRADVATVVNRDIRKSSVENG